MKHEGLEFKKGHGNTGDIIVDTLINHGVDEIETYKNISMDNVPLLDPSNLNNIDKAYDRLEKSIDNNEKIGILVDGDADGFASASLLYKALLQLTDSVYLFTTENKTHGLDAVLDDIIAEEYDLIITPDSSSNDKVAHQKLKNEYNTDVIVLDHHIIDNLEDSESDPAIIVNNQSNNNDTNKNYVGVGIVYLFIRYIEVKKNVFNMNEFLPLFALGQITDMSDVSDPEIKAQVDKGLELFKEHLLFKQFVHNLTPSIHKVSFEIAPKINAMSRIGSKDERYRLLYSMAEVEDISDTKVMTKRRKNYATGVMESKLITLNPYQQEADELIKIKGKQDRLVKKVVENLDYISHKDAGLVIAQLDEDTTTSITGLLANKIIAKTQTPALVLKKSDYEPNLLIGSMRCPGMFEMRTWLNNTDIAKSSGHEQAAGVEIDANNIEKLLENAKELDVSQSFYNVDKVYDEYSTSKKDIQYINDNMDLFGGKIKEPVLGFKSIPVSKSAINIRNSVINFKYNDLNFIIFNGSDFVDWFMNTGFKNEFYFDVVGNAGESNWKNNTTPQLVVKDIALTTKNELKVETPEDMVF